MDPIALAACLVALSYEAPRDTAPATNPSVEAQRRSTSPLERAIERARSNGRLVLVLVVASDLETRRRESGWLSDLLAANGDELLLDLSLVEIAFATEAQLGDAIRLPMPSWNRDAIGLIECFGDGPRWTPIRLAYGPWFDSCGLPALRLADAMQRTAELLRRALLDDAELVERQLARVRAGLDARELAATEARLESGVRLSWQPIERAAWLYRVALHREAPLAERWRRLLIFIGGRRVLEGVHGARWLERTHNGLDVHFRTDDDADERARFAERAERESLADGSLAATWRHRADCIAGPCGTGSTPVVSYRFLDEYVLGLVMTPDEN